MRDRLNEFIDLANRYEASERPGDIIGDRALWNTLHRVEPTIQRILHRLDPDMNAIDVGEWAGVQAARNAAHRGLGILDDYDELDRRLAPNAPVLPADQMHPWVWDAARTLWQSTHYRQAVHAGVTSVNAHTQTKLGRRDVSDDKLVQEAFSEKPPEPGKPRLRIPGDPADPTVQSRQRGALQLGLACFFAIRNPAAHETNEWSEQQALEQLATLSVLARLIDRCQIVR